jgi:hypothetical protein
MHAEISLKILEAYMDTERAQRTREELLDAMRDLGWELSGTVSAQDYSTFAFTNAGAGEDAVNTLSLVGYGADASESERFEDAVRRYLADPDLVIPDHDDIEG